MTPSGFYAWRQRPESTRSRDDRRLKVLVQASFDERANSGIGARALFFRFIVGWAVSAVNDRHLTIKALEMAVTRRRCPMRACCITPTRGHLCQRGLPNDA